MNLLRGWVVGGCCCRPPTYSSGWSTCSPSPTCERSAVAGSVSGVGKRSRPRTGDPIERPRNATDREVTVVAIDPGAAVDPFEPVGTADLRRGKRPAYVDINFLREVVAALDAIE